MFNKVNKSSRLQGLIKNKPEDFQVDEIPQFKPSGKGEHVWLHIQKTGENTDWVANLLAKIAEVPRKDVSYAGMKDRHAVTTQWFSVQMPGREAPDWEAQLPDSIIVLDEQRHTRKLKRGALEGNRFSLIIRNFIGEEDELKESVNRILEQGIPNYFGEQRFGKDGENIRKASQWFKGEFTVKSRSKRSIYLSAARSWIFNHILSVRVKDNTWNKAEPGDIFMLDGSKSCFNDVIDESIMQRIFNQEIHPTGALWGKGGLVSKDHVENLEKKVAKELLVFSKGLEAKGLRQERKALRLRIRDFEYHFLKSYSEIDANKCSSVLLKFSLPAGAFATSVLREIGDFKV